MLSDSFGIEDKRKETLQLKNMKEVVVVNWGVSPVIVLLGSINLQVVEMVLCFQIICIFK